MGALFTLAKESISAHISKNRYKAISKAMSQLDRNSLATKNKLQHLENDFLMFGDYDINSTASIIKNLNYLGNKTFSLENWIRGKDKDWSYCYRKENLGPTMFVHHLHIYLNSVNEKYIRLYQRLESDLKVIIRSISLLSKGFLPPHMFPPSLLANISSEAIQMVKPHHPDYALALNHVLDYYDLPLVTFGRDHKDRLVVCFPILIKEYHKQPLSLYQIETDSYSQVLIHKKIRFTYFCEELFLSKHSTHKSCASSLFFNRTDEEIKATCTFEYFYNRTVTPSVLDGGSEIILANFKDRKVLSCPHRPTKTQPMSLSSYVKVPRDILCFCELQSGLVSLDKTVTICNATNIPVLEYTLNLGFYHTLKPLWEDAWENLTTAPSPKLQVFPVSLDDFSKDEHFDLYSDSSNPVPTTLAQLSHLSYQKQAFLKNRK